MSLYGQLSARTVARPRGVASTPRLRRRASKYRFAPGDKDEAPAFKFDSIFMVASDIRATTFDKEEPDPEDLNRGGPC